MKGKYNTSPDISRAEAVRQGGYYGKKGTWNELYVDPGTGRLLRDRIENLIVSKNGKEIFLRLQGGDKYRLPGGGKESIHRTAKEQVIEETKEEARIIVDNVIDTGIEWSEVYKEPGDKARLEGDKLGQILWYGNHTNLYISEYVGKYNGDIKPIDRDVDLTEHGAFYPIDAVWYILKNEHRKALQKFNIYSVTELVEKIEESTDIFKFNKLLRNSDRVCRSYSDRLTLETAIDAKLESLLSISEFGGILPYYTPSEMIQMGVFNEEKNNYYKAQSNMANKEWFDVYNTTGNPGLNYSINIFKEYCKFIDNPTDINRQSLLEMGWNPEIKLTKGSLKKSMEYTKDKLKEFYSPIQLIDLCNLNEEYGLIDTIEDTIVPLGKSVFRYIKKCMEQYPELIGLSYKNIDFDSRLIDNGNKYRLLRYEFPSITEDDDINDGPFQGLLKLQEYINGFIIDSGYIQYHAVVVPDNDADKVKNGYLIIQQRIESGYLNYVRESVCYRNEMATPVSAISPVVGIVPKTKFHTNYLQKNVLDKEYEQAIRKGEYSGNIDLDYAKSIGSDERKKVTEMVCMVLHNNKEYNNVSIPSYISFITEQSNSLLICTNNNNSREMMTEMNGVLNSIKNNQYSIVLGEYDTLYLTTNKSLSESSLYVNENGLFNNRKELVDAVVAEAKKNGFNLKISKAGDWGLNDFLAGNGDRLFLIADKDKQKAIKKCLSKITKNTKASIVLDNYYTVFLKAKHVSTVSEDTLLESKKRNSLYPIFIINSFTDTAFGKLITKYTGDLYSHSAISIDTSLSKLYTFNTNPTKTNPFGGFAVETIEQYRNSSPISRIQINTLFVPEEVYKKISQTIEDISNNASNTTYAISNLFKILIHKGDKEQNINSMICSQFVDNILKTVNIDITNSKHSNLVTPSTFSKLNNPRIYKLFEGNISDFDINLFKSKLYRLLNKRHIKGINEVRLLSLLDIKPVIESTSFPVQFDDDGNLLIANRKKLDYDKEWKKTKKLRTQYVKHNNITGMKYEAAKCWYIYQCIEMDIADEKHSFYDKDELVLFKSRILTEFSQYMKYILKVQDDFNFTAYYNSTPFSNDTTQINASTLKYANIYIKSFFKHILY